MIKIPGVGIDIKRIENIDVDRNKKRRARDWQRTESTALCRRNDEKQESQTDY